MITRLDNGNEYCDCLDWNADFKECQISTMNVFNAKFHTTGVTPEEQRAYYITLEDKTPEEIKLGNELQQLVTKSE